MRVAVVVGAVLLSRPVLVHAEEPPAPTNPVSATRCIQSPEDPGKTVELWDSERSKVACAEAKLNALAAALRKARAVVEAGGSVGAAERALDTGQAQLPAVCTEGVIGNLTPGTEVKVLARAEECAELVPVRVVSGKYQEKVGCISGDQLGAKRP